jgi:hypothetical protein
MILLTYGTGLGLLLRFYWQRLEWLYNWLPFSFVWLLADLVLKGWNGWVLSKWPKKVYRPYFFSTQIESEINHPHTYAKRMTAPTWIVCLIYIENTNCWFILQIKCYAIQLQSKNKNILDKLVDVCHKLFLKLTPKSNGFSLHLIFSESLLDYSFYPNNQTLWHFWYYKLNRCKVFWLSKFSK